MVANWSCGDIMPRNYDKDTARYQNQDIRPTPDDSDMELGAQESLGDDDIFKGYKDPNFKNPDIRKRNPAPRDT
jgi:hypothetical protein